MKKRTYATMIVLIMTAASMGIGCGNTKTDITTYQASEEVASAAADRSEVQTEDAKTDIVEAIPGKTMEMTADTKAEAVMLEKETAAQKSSVAKPDTPKPEAKTDTSKTDTKSPKAASPKVDDTAAENPQDTVSPAKTQEAQEDKLALITFGSGTSHVTVPANSNKDTKQNTASQANSTQQAPSEGQQNKPSKVTVSANHEHVWKEIVRTKQEWVPNVVTVDDYDIETKTVSYAHCNCGAVLTEAEYPAHYQAHEDKGECSDSHWEAEEVEVGRTKVGSHEEDQGYYKDVTYVDHVQCSICGIDKASWEWNLENTQ